MSQQTKQPTNFGALGTLVTVFFFWGFIAASNSIFIPFCKSHFALSQFESQLVGSAFYGAYFIGSLILFLVSNVLGYDILNKIGYKRGIIYGLLISVAGALLMLPSANANSFPALLASLFVIALGFSLQQTAAQPFAISLGDPATGSHRLNLGGGVNSLGTTLGPIIVSFFLFGSVGASDTVVTVTNINTLYLIVAGVFFTVAMFFLFSKLPSGKNDEKFEKGNKAAGSLMLMTGIIIAIIITAQLAEIPKMVLLLITLVAVIGILFFSNVKAQANGDGWGAMKYPQLIYGMLGIFVYVGVEVTIDNNFGALLKTPDYLTKAGLNESEISKYISLYWGSLMIGRWTGAVSVFNLKGMAKIIARIVIPFIAFGVVLYVNHLHGSDVSDLWGLCRMCCYWDRRILLWAGKTCQNISDGIYTCSHCHVDWHIYKWYYFSICFNGRRSFLLRDVALYFCTGDWRSWEIYRSGLGLPHHDDPGWSDHSTTAGSRR